jgi:arylsulfatase A-like enzyme
LTNARRPSIVLILADDMGYGDFGCFNGGLSSTPVLDGLVGASTCLTRHYAASPVCSPSRAGLMSGRYPHRTGAIDTMEWRGLDRLALRETTIADLLRRGGYATGLVGKWHLGAFDPRYHPAARGFDETVCFRGAMQDYWRWRIEYGHRVTRGDGRYLTDVWTEESVAFIRRHRQEPFFLHVAYNAPHTPMQAPLEEVRPFADTGRHTTAVSTLYGMLHRMDTGIGRILETLREYGLEENTIVMFTSDNGPYLGGDGDASLERFNCGFKGSKRLVYEGGLRVPMLVRWPAGLGPGAREIDAPTHFCDWLPTILSMAGVGLPDDSPRLDGRDLYPFLKGDVITIENRQRFWQWTTYVPTALSNAAVSDGEWKLVRPAIPGTLDTTDADRRWIQVAVFGPEHFIHQGLAGDPAPTRPALAALPSQLYHLATDPGEQVDVSADEPGRVTGMLRGLEDWFADVERDRAGIGA